MSQDQDKKYSFSKSEKLCSRILIEKLYSSPHRELFFPLSVHWMLVDGDDTTPRLRVLIVAPKRKLHHAVDRNRSKRVMRECYRRHKHLLIESLATQDKHMVLSINYIHTSTPNFHKLNATMEKVMRRLGELKVES